MEHTHFIASQDLLWLKNDGTEVAISARVGMPYQAEDGTFRCPAELAGVDGRYPDLIGEGSMQALCIAIKLIATRLEHLLQTGERIVYSTDRSSAWDRNSWKSVFGR